MRIDQALIRLNTIIFVTLFTLVATGILVTIMVVEYKQVGK